MVSQNDSSPRRQHNPWNKGRLIDQKRPLKPRDVWTIRVRLQLGRPCTKRTDWTSRYVRSEKSSRIHGFIGGLPDFSGRLDTL
jgi:hypothetical protein